MSTSRDSMSATLSSQPRCDQPKNTSKMMATTAPITGSGDRRILGFGSKLLVRVIT
jgi:hypothetical protein